MSINRDMRKYMLQENQPIEGKSGAERENWVDVNEIEAAIYKKNDMKVAASEKYIKSTHTGLTHYRLIAPGKHRIVKDGVIYQIEDCNPQGRLTNLLLKVVS